MSQCSPRTEHENAERTLPALHYLDVRTTNFLWARKNKAADISGSHIGSGPDGGRDRVATAPILDGYLGRSMHRPVGVVVVGRTTTVRGTPQLGSRGSVV